MWREAKRVIYTDTQQGETGLVKYIEATLGDYIE